MNAKGTIGLAAVLCLLLSTCSAQKTKSGYIFTSPRNLKIGTKNELQLFRSGCTEEGELKVGLYFKNKTLMYEKDYQLQKGETISFFDFEVPQFNMKNLYEGRLQINGTICDASISGNDKVQFSTPKSSVIIIQTDKPFYKPGQTVKFRVLKLDKNLKPSGNEDDVADVYVEDPHGTRLFQFNRLSIGKGIVQKEFPLSDEPVKGNWKITVTRKDGTDTANFDVKDYVLPKFDVKINFPSFALTTVKTFPIEMCARYTYGEPLRGQLNFSVSLDRYSYGYNQKKYPVLENSVKLDGCYNYTVNVSLIDPQNDSTYSRIKVVVNIVEDGTGVQIDKTDYFSRQSSPLHLNFHTDPNQRNYFKPGLPFNGRLQVTNPDNTPAADEPISICVTVSRKRLIYEWWANKKVQFCSNYTSGADGYVRYSLLPQSVDTVSVSFQAKSLKYTRGNSGNLNVPDASMSLSPFYSPSGSFVQIAPIERPLTCGSEQPITLLFTSKKNADYKFYYEVINKRGNIQKGDQKVSFNVKDDAYTKYAKKDQLINQQITQISPEINGKSDSASKEDCPAARDIKYLPPIGETVIKIPVDASMPTSFHLLVFYVRNDKEIVADSQAINVGACFNNKVDMKFGDAIKQPGTNTTIEIETAPDSVCGIKVQDKSVSLLDSHDSLSKDRIFQILDGMERNDYYTSSRCDEKNPQPGFPNAKAILPLLPGLYSASSYEDSYASFQAAGYLVISNLLLFTRPCQNNGASYDDDYDGSVTAEYATGEYITGEYYEAEDSSVAAPKGKLIKMSLARPSLAGASVNTQSAKSIRDNFAETWLFNLVMTGSDGRYVSEETLPDTITDWVGNAVCISPEKGLGLSNSTTITGFQAFFISYTLPVSVIRGEEFYVVVSIFNYVDDALAITVNLDQSHGLEVAGDSINGDICIHPDTSSSLKLKLKATAVGKVNLTVRAETAHNSKVCRTLPVYKQPARDAITQSLEVKAEGYPAEKVKSILFCPSDAANKVFTQEVDLVLPDDVIPDSSRAFVDVTGDVMGPTIRNLNNLVQIPTGCGEQNIVKFTPNILVMDYLSSIRKLTADVKNRATQNLYTGYQRELNYRHRDGSFSAFGQDIDDEGSMFLTALVLESFTKAQEYITIDKSILTSMQKFIVSHQQKNGCFPNMGKIVDYGLEGGVEDEKNPHSLTAYVVKSLLTSKYENRTVIDNALSCLKQDRILTYYETFLYAYAEALSGDKEEARTIVDKIKPFIHEKDGMAFYKNPNGTQTLDIETAAYAILTSLELGNDISDFLPLVKYLTTNLNPTGGFYSTQDTVVGLTALTGYAKIVYKDTVDLSVAITEGLDETVKVTEDNKLLVQRNKVSKVPSQLKIEASGKGCGLLQTSLRYNTKTSPDENKFSLHVVGTCTNPDCKKRRISVEVSYLPNGKKAGMSVVQIKMVSGTVPVKDSLQKAMDEPDNNIMRFDVEGNEVILYFSEVTNESYSFSFDVDEIVEVVNAKPATAEVYDYYSPENSAMTSYSFPSQKKAPNSQPQEKAPKSPTQQKAPKSPPQ